MINMTPVAVAKVLEIMNQQDPKPEGLRVAVIGGGCSGFQYHMSFILKGKPEESPKEKESIHETDIMHEFGESGKLKVFVDQMSLIYLDGIEIDWIETIEDGVIQSGFKFNNPNVKSTCGCGSSFSA